MIPLKLQEHISGKDGEAEATKTNKIPSSFARYQAKLKIETLRLAKTTKALVIMRYPSQITSD